MATDAVGEERGSSSTLHSMIQSERAEQVPIQLAIFYLLAHLK